MNSQIEERIKIAEQFKSIYGYTDKMPGKRKKWLQFSAAIDYWMVMAMLVFLIYISLMAILQIEPISLKWQKSGLLVLLIFSMAIRSPYAYIELLLLKHINNLENLDLTFPEFLNQDLKEIISKLNNKKHHINIIGLPSLVIALGGLLQVIELNPFWNYFTFLVLAFSPILIIRINYQIRIVKKHLIKFEAIIKNEK